MFLVLWGCTSEYNAKVKLSQPVISSGLIHSNKIVFSGTGLDDVRSLKIKISESSFVETSIAQQSDSTLEAVLQSPISWTSLSLLSLVVSTANAQSIVPLSLSTSDFLTVGGNTQATDLSLGTNDSYNLNLLTLGEPRLTILPTGWVGIGTTTPARVLHVNSDDVAFLKLQSGSTGDASQIEFQRGDGSEGLTYFGLASSQLDLFSAANIPFVIGLNAAEKMRILPTGEVGIGTSSPLHTLHIQRDIAAGTENSILVLDGRNNGTNHGMSIDFKNSSTTGSGYLASIIAIDEATSDGRLEFRTSSNGAINATRLLASDTKMTINSRGNVGVGTTSPGTDSELHIYKTGANADIRLESSVGSALFDIFESGTTHGFWGYTTAPFLFATNALERMRIDGAGNVGIGTTAPQAMLDVNGDIRLAKRTSEPEPCTLTIDGRISLTSNYTTCVCKGTTLTWVRTSDGSTACAW